MATSIAWIERNGSLTPLDVDALIREGIDSPSEVTEHPVERRSEIADHVRPKPEVLTLEFRITDTPIRAPLTHTNGINGEPTQTLDGATVLTFDGPLNRVDRVYQDLQRVRRERLFWQVETSLRRYDSFQAESIKVNRDNRTGGAATFMVTLKEVRIISTRIASIPRLRRIQPRVNAGAQPNEAPPESMIHSGVEAAQRTANRLLNRR